MSTRTIITMTPAEADKFLAQEAELTALRAENERMKATCVQWSELPAKVLTLQDQLAEWKTCHRELMERVLQAERERDGLRKQLENFAWYPDSSPEQAQAPKTVIHSATLDSILRERDEAHLKLTALGELAVSYWDDATVGDVDSVVKEPRKYKDELRVLFVDNPKLIAQLRADLAAGKEIMQGAYAELLSAHVEIEKLTADLAAAREDVARLDWMSAQNRIDYCTSYWLRSQLAQRPERTLRAAIDAARAKGTQP